MAKRKQKPFVKLISLAVVHDFENEELVVVACGWEKKDIPSFLEWMGAVVLLNLYDTKYYLTKILFW